ncbi:MAG: hypothetical protein OEU26_22270 [Candidatus Tectomicrobia bacterium]|nr:hypothetical protein [Candidatus Tectomicrobia bacterium]
MEQPESILYLSHSTLEGLALTTQEVVDSIEHLIHGRSQSKVWNAPKSVILPPDGRYMMATLSAADDPPFLAVKSLLLNPRNRERGLPDIHSMVILLDSDTGLSLAIMDGNWITAIRTAGLSAVAAKRLARPDASTAAFIGCCAPQKLYPRRIPRIVIRRYSVPLAVSVERQGPPEGAVALHAVPFVLISATTESESGPSAQPHQIHGGRW